MSCSAFTPSKSVCEIPKAGPPSRQLAKCPKLARTPSRPTLFWIHLGHKNFTLFVHHPSSLGAQDNVSIVSPVVTGWSSTVEQPRDHRFGARRNTRQENQTSWKTDLWGRVCYSTQSNHTYASFRLNHFKLVCCCVRALRSECEHCIPCPGIRAQPKQ
jgi:hypothetical protein